MKNLHDQTLLRNAGVLVLVFMTCFGNDLFGQQDSSKTTLQIYPRLHSAGYFPFTGSLLNHNPVADVNVFYEKRSRPGASGAVGFFLFQSFDLKDRHSYANYFQPGFFATLNVHPTFKIRGFFGYIFSQTQSFKDPGSDYYAATSFYWDPTKHLSIQNTVLFYDYTVQRKLANRVLVSISYPKFKVDMFLWNRAVLAEKKQAVSASVAVTFPIIKLTDKASIHLTTSYMRYLTTYRPSYALDDGFIVTLGAPINVKS
jgi:hypothetical protein